MEALTPDRWSDIVEAFEEAAELSGPERIEFLSRLAESDPEAEAEVRALLEADAAGGGFDRVEGFLTGPRVADVLRETLDRSQLEGSTGGTALVAAYELVSPADVAARLGAALDGRYAIERELMQGGMAIVYLAHDVRHARRVALKVMKPELASLIGKDRFLSEVRTTAGLQHPHILPLFDSGEAAGFLYYVTPFVEGEALRARLDRERELPVDEAIRIASAVAGALDYAHRHGVVHCDVKPSNILLHDGEPIIADFGIAQAVGIVGEDEGEVAGLALGTPRYMSPEQVTRDHPIGPATDVFAVGSVLYEMLTGRPAFGSEPGDALLAKLLEGEPTAVTQLRPTVPVNVEAAVRCALERLPADRFGSAQAFSDALADPSFRGLAPRRHARYPTTGNRLAGGLAAVMAVLLVALGWLGAHRLGPPTPTERMVWDLGDSNIMNVDFGVRVAFSPDGSTIAYVGLDAAGERTMWLKERGALRARRLIEAEHPSQAIFSPEGDRIAFTGAGPAQAGIGVLSLADGSVESITNDGVVGRGGSWSDDGWIYAAVSSRHIVRYRVGTGERQDVTRLDGSGDQEHARPVALPAGRGLLYVRVDAGAYEDAQIMVLDLRSGESRELTPGAFALYSTTGHLLVLSVDGVLMGAPFDLADLEMTGPLVPLVVGVGVGIDNGANLAISSVGDLAYTEAMAGASGTDREIVWVSRDGAMEPVSPEWRARFEGVTVSPTGDRFAVAIGTELSSDLWVGRFDGRPPTRLTFVPGTNRRPVWTSTGDSLVFISDREGGRAAYAKRADGEGDVTRLSGLPDGVDEVHLSVDGRSIAYRTGFSGGERDVHLARAGAEGWSSEPVAVRPGVVEYSPSVSPDGRYVAYTSTETGAGEVWVRSTVAEGGSRWQVSDGGGRLPRWVASGDELTYLAGMVGGRMVSAKVETDPTFSVLGTEALFDVSGIFLQESHQPYDVSADGERFLMIRERRADVLSELVVVHGFDQELLGATR